MSSIKPLLIANTLLVFAVAACAQNPGKQQSENSARVQCPPGETIVCEVRNTGRIMHGTFSNKNSRCACKDSRTDSPNIPDIK
jgi:hypothetical protein